MGFRVNKILGYGITDFKGFDKDDRLKSDILQVIENDPNKYNSENFKQYVYDYLKKTDWNDSYGNLVWNFYFDETIHKKKQLSNHFNSTLINCDSSELLYRFMIYDDENESSVLLFTNPIDTTWWRIDNTIDYYEEDGIPDEKVKVIEYGIYPYNSIFHDIRNKNIVQFQLVHAIKSIQKNGGSDDIKNEVINKLLEQSSFKNYDEYKRYCNVVVPEVIVMYLNFVDFFNKDKYSALELTPMLYTVWR